MLSARITDKISDMILAIILSFSFVYTLEESLILYYDKTKIFLIVAALFLMFSALFYNRLTSIVTACVLGAGALAAVAFFTVTHMWGRIISYIDNYVYWIMAYTQYPVEHSFSYVLITVFFLSITISLFIYIFAVKHFIFPLLLITGAALFSVQWINKFIVNLTPFYIFVFIILLYYFKYIHHRRFTKGENDYVNSTSLLIGLLPVCIIIFITSSLFRISEKPIEWKWMDAKVDSALDYIDQKYNNSIYNYYSFSSSGFSINNGKLGGQVNSDSTPVLKVKTTKRVYLKGVNKDIYTGSSWMESKQGTLLPAYSPENIKNNFLESLAVNYMANASINTLPAYCSRADMTIKFENLKTKSIFVPLNFSSLYEGESTTTFLNELLSSGNGSLFFPSRQAKGYTYSVSTLVFDYSNSELSANLRNCSSGYLDTLALSYPEEYETASIPLYSPNCKIINVSLSDYAKSAEAVREKYMQLPDELPQRVRDLASSITDKYNNDYDKAKALEKFLSSNFPYTLKTKSLPRNRDFVDYFIFDQRKGYCTYFASAMAVMARCAGIPARYVEGYMLPSQTDDQGFYIVTNKNAHAWVEIYLEGFGWTTFEPTASYVRSFYSNSPSALSQTESDKMESEYDNGSDEYNRMLERYRMQDSSQVFLPDSSIETAGKANKHQYLYIIIIAIAFTLFFITLNLINLVRHRFKIYIIGKQSPRESILTAYRYYLELLGLQRFPIIPGETPLTYAKRIDNNLLLDNIKFKKVSQTFVKAKYSTMEISEHEKKEVFNFHQDLLKDTKQNIGKLKFYWLKNILGKI